jgi:phosphoglucosamine mutase
LKLLNSLKEVSFNVNESVEEFNKFPQTLINLSVNNPNKIILNDKFWSEVTYIESKLKEKGRVLIRPSGTEPLIRIMVESENEKDSEDYANRLADLASKL